MVSYNNYIYTIFFFIAKAVFNDFYILIDIYIKKEKTPYIFKLVKIRFYFRNLLL